MPHKQCNALLLLHALLLLPLCYLSRLAGLPECDTRHTLSKIGHPRLTTMTILTILSI